MNKLKKFLFKLLKIILVTSLIIFCIYSYCDYQTYGYRKFDKDLWVKTSIGEYTGGIVNDYLDYRCGMYNDLVKNHLKKGMKIEEVIKMLGKTDLKYYCIDKKIKCLYYRLGTCTDFILDIGHNHTYICFDSNNQYISAGLSHHNDKICGGEDKVIGCFKNECGGPQKGKNGLSIKFDYEQW